MYMMEHSTSAPGIKTADIIQLSPILQESKRAAKLTPALLLRSSRFPVALNEAVFFFFFNKSRKSLKSVFPEQHNPAVL